MTAPALTVYTNGLSSVNADNLNTFKQTCDNVAQLRAFVGTSGIEVEIRGTATIADGGQGTFYWNATATATTNPDDNGVTNVVPSGAATGVWTRIAPISYVGSSNISAATVTATGALTARSLANYFADILSVKDFGAIGNNTHDDTAAINAAYAAAISSGNALYFPAGTYKVTSQLTFACSTTGVTIRGAGVGLSIINMQSFTTSPNMLITAVVPANGTDGFVMKGIGLQGNTTGIVFQIGNESFNDAHNEPELDILVQNFNTTGTARAVELNYVLNGDLRIIADVGGNGYGLICNQVAFSTIMGSMSAILGTSIRMTSGFNLGNVFLNVDLENCATGVFSDSANNQGNTFIGGTWSYTSSGVNSSAGKDLQIINPNINPAGPGTLAGFVGNGVGVHVKTTQISDVTPAVPASTAVYTNNQGRDVLVSMWGGTITQILINGSGIILPSGGLFLLKSGDTVAITYSVAPNWVWRSLT